MHSSDPGKDAGAFRKEVDAILAGTSRFHRPTDKFDFSWFVFPEVNFAEVTFTRAADFSQAKFSQAAIFFGATFTQAAIFFDATFTQAADFVGATFSHAANFHAAKFTQAADFGGAQFSKAAGFRDARFTHEANFGWATFADTADFGWATFTQEAFFFEATFTQEADFGGAKFSQVANFHAAKFLRGAMFSAVTFNEEANFTHALFGASNDNPTVEQNGELAIADFSGAKFIKPELVRFLQVNREGRSGFRARFVDCLINGVLFEDIHWHRERGRMVLQDELDRLANEKDAASYEQVAAACRRFVINFDEAKHYELAEDCMIGAMEMKRLDPSNFLFSRWLRAYYERWSWLRWLGEQVSVTNLYRLASNYGSSYLRALGVLGLLLLGFALLFILSGVNPNPSRSAGALAPKGLIHAVEVATFQSQTRYVVGNGLGWMLEQVERLLVPAQVALLLLAVRRRFRR